jgi:hypothetical protein
MAPAQSRGSQFYSEWSKFGAPEEIRTPDPQIRSLGETIEIIEVRYRKKAAVRRNWRNSGSFERTPLP